MADDLPALTLPPYLDNLIAGPGTRASTQPLLQPETYTERSVSEFLGHFSGYLPMYFIAGPYDPAGKFEFSFKYQVFNKEAPLAKKIPLLSGLTLAYSQLSTWALNKTGEPLRDNNYMPEVFYSNEDIKLIHIPGVSELGLQAGYGHESNGVGGTPDERSINMLFFRPIFDFGDPEGLHFLVAPKAFIYVNGVPDNPDIAKYRGYVDLRMAAGWRQGLEVSFLGRIGSDYNRGSVQFDVTYPIRDLLDKNIDLYVDAQYFNGYGETLIVYNQHTQAFRLGIALVR